MKNKENISCHMVECYASILLLRRWARKEGRQCSKSESSERGGSESPNSTHCDAPADYPKGGTWYCYGGDLTKNICEIYSPAGYIRTVYTYTPYGEVTASGSVAQSPRGLGGGLDKPKGFAPQGRGCNGAAASQSPRRLVGGLDKPKGFAPQGRGRNGVRPSQSPRGFGGGLDKPKGFAPQGRAADGAAASQPLQWSSEYADTELGLVYYNYRYYNPIAGRWTRRDDDQGRKDLNDYLFSKNIPSQFSDVRGLWIWQVLLLITGSIAGSYTSLATKDECSLAGEVSVKRVRQTCIRTCEYPGWACCRNPEMSEIRKAKYVCESTAFGNKWKFLQWLDRNKPKPGKCENKRCIDRGVNCSIA